MDNMPISVIINAMRDEIMDTVKKYNLHPSISQLILKDVCNQISDVANIQYAREKEEYERSSQEVKEDAESIQPD